MKIHDVQILFNHMNTTGYQMEMGVSIVNKKFLPELIQRHGRSIVTNNQVWEQREKIGGILIQ